MSIIIILVAAYFLFIHKFKSEDGSEQKGYEKLMEMLNKKGDSSSHAGESQPFSSPTPKKESYSSKSNVSRPQAQPAANALTIGTIGPAASGKTTLTAGITQILAKKGLAQEKKYDEIDCDPEEKAMGKSIHVHTIEYSDGENNFIHLDCPGDPEYINTMMAGARKMKAAILVLDATKLDTNTATEQIMLAHKANIERIIVFINKIDMIPPEVSTEQFRRDIRKILKENGFDEHTPIIEDSAFYAINGDNDLESFFKILSPYVTNGSVPEENNFLTMEYDLVVILYSMDNTNKEKVCNIIAENTNRSIDEANKIIENLPNGPQICYRGISDTKQNVEKFVNELKDLNVSIRYVTSLQDEDVDAFFVCFLDSLGSASKESVIDELVNTTHISEEEANEIISDVENNPNDDHICFSSKSGDATIKLAEKLCNLGAQADTGTSYKLSNE
ncbi:MAG: hypothetical protein J6W37_06950 [Bacteroidales bacterium]|nr:hypothetical protein [Bacteroidales bacterium]